MSKLEKLLQEVCHIVVLNNKEQEEKRKRGEKFNVFTTLGLWGEEVKLHSRFIATLLNPKADHGLNDAFLKVFLKVFLEQNEFGEFDFDTANAQVKVEDHIGKIDEKYESGGSIDIIIRSQDKAIVIENKVYAQDQKNQLFRYNTYCKEKYDKNYRLLYLTLYGHSASEYSLNGMKEEEYSKISYSTHIIKWLERCLELSDKYPIIRETIKQYLHLIRRITRQSMDNKYKEELIELLSKEENFSSAIEIINVGEKVMNNIFDKHFHDKFSERLNYDFNADEMIFEVTSSCDNDSYGDPEKDKRYTAKNFKIFVKPNTWKSSVIGFQFDKDNRRSLHYGIRCYQNIDANQKQEILKQFSGFKPTNYWTCKKAVSGQIENWDKSIHAEMFNKDSRLYLELSKLVREMIDKTKDMQIM